MEKRVSVVSELGTIRTLRTFFGPISIRSDRFHFFRSISHSNRSYNNILTPDLTMATIMLLSWPCLRPRAAALTLAAAARRHHHCRTSLTAVESPGIYKGVLSQTGGVGVVVVNEQPPRFRFWYQCRCSEEFDVLLFLPAVTWS